MRMLMVEDDQALGRVLAASLSRNDFVVDLAQSLEDAQAYLDTGTYSLLLLDVGLPDGDGLRLFRNRARPNFPPAIVLTGADDIAERVRGLDAGADDYVSKPCAQAELMARIRAVLRRPHSSGRADLAVGDLVLDSAARSVSVNGRTLVLPRRELVILEALMHAPGRVVMRESLEEAVYAYGEEPLSNATEANISRLRKHLKAGGSLVEVHVVRGLGYILSATPHA